MPFYKQLNKDFYIKNNRIVLSDNFVKTNQKHFKKITGTRFSSILELSQYASPVKTWAQMVGIYKEEMDPLLGRAGGVIEPKVREYVEQKLNIKYKFYDPSKINWDCFNDVEIFGGIPDGEPVDENGKFLYDKNIPMLEIKTSSYDKLSFVYNKEKKALFLKLDENNMPIVKIAGEKKKTWFGTDNKMIIPTEYVYQLSLYLYLRKAKKGMFAVTFLRPEDYAHPEWYKVESHEIHLVEMELKDNKWIQQQIEKAKNWYEKYIKSNFCSPEFTANDIKWLEEQFDTTYANLTK